MHVLRATLATSWLLIAAAAHAQSGGADPGIYRYKNREGRVVFTNIPEQVPLEQRAGARMNLNRVELNTETGRELSQRIAEQYQALQRSTGCQRRLAEADASYVQTLWDEFAPLVVCGGILLLLFLLTPSALKRFSAPDWAKLLMTAIPGLALGGLSMFAMNSTSKMLSDLKQRAAPCKTETFDKLASAPDGLRKQMELIDQLRREAQ